MTKYYFYGALPNGTKGLVVAIDLPGITEAYRILRAHSNIRSFSPTRLEGEAKAKAAGSSEIRMVA